MRIVYMLTSLGIGGAERQVIALAERMAARGHEIALMVLRDRVQCEWITSVPIIRLEMTKSSVGIIKGLIRGRRFLRRFQPDLVHSHTFPANIAARWLRGIMAAPAVLSTVHNIYEGGQFRMLAYRLTDRWSVHTTMVSEAIAKQYIGIGAVSKHKCSVITNGIDVRRFSPDSASGAFSRDSMNDAGGFVWLAVGRITAAKDYGTLIRAFACVLASDTGGQLWIAGESTSGEGSTLKALVRQLGVEKTVHWLGYREDMVDLLSAADGLVLSSAWEGMPLVVGEAMAMEKPVVATDVGGVRELVGNAGVIVPARDPDRLAHAMLQVMRASNEERSALGRRARERILQEFDMDAKADEWLALYSRLVSDWRWRAAKQRVIT